jgi:pimeloyl-ACP methyl ester carboxylesterase
MIPPDGNQTSERTVDLGSATIRNREAGAGPPVVFVHGLLVDGSIWDRVVPAVVAAGHRCLVPDWPLGAHRIPVPDADLTPPGVAHLVAEFIEALGLDDVTIVANDTGGAITQILLVERPERIGRVVLTPCDAFDQFIPPPFDKLPQLARVPGFVWTFVQAARSRRVLATRLGFGWLAKHGVPGAMSDRWLAPSRSDRRIRHDLRRFVSAIDPRHTMAAAARLGSFSGPVLLVWASEDKVFLPSLAERLAGALSRPTLTWVADSYAFVPLDQPEVLARRVVDFLGAGTQTQSG